MSTEYQESLSKVKLLWDTKCLLGESPVWDRYSNILYFIDIKNSALHAWSKDQVNSIYKLSNEISCIVPSGNNKLLAAYKNFFSYISLYPFSEEIVDLDGLDEPINNRFNDGKCDTAGRLWIASMDDNCVKESGALWSFQQKNNCLKKHFNGFCVGNGIDWNVSGNLMYFTDSEKRKIFTYDYDVNSGKLGRRNLFADIGPDVGLPDGLTVDSEDCVWSAHWDGWRITRYKPNGNIDRIINLPIPRPTSVAFGGEDCKTLFITSASQGLTREMLTKAPLSGGLFCLETDITGKYPSSFDSDVKCPILQNEICINE